MLLATIFSLFLLISSCCSRFADPFDDKIQTESHSEEFEPRAASDEFSSEQIPDHWILASYADGTPIPGLAESRQKTLNYSLDPLIVNGRPAPRGGQPYMVSLQVINQGRAFHICGGHLSTPVKVVTAAHCLNDLPSQITLMVGLGYYQLSLGTQNPGSQFIKVASGYVNPQFHMGGGFPFDIAVLTLAQPAQLTPTVQTVRMSSQLPPAFYGQRVTLTGWGRNGRTNDPVDILQIAEYTVITKSDCQSVWGDKILDQHVCCYGPPQGSCQGDSGGPLVHNGYVMGIVSWGQEHCDVQYPSVYNNPGYQKPWLQKLL